MTNANKHLYIKDAAVQNVRDLHIIYNMYLKLHKTLYRKIVYITDAALLNVCSVHLIKTIYKTTLYTCTIMQLMHNTHDNHLLSLQAQCLSCNFYKMYFIIFSVMKHCS